MDNKGTESFNLNEIRIKAVKQKLVCNIFPTVYFYV